MLKSGKVLLAAMFIAYASPMALAQFLSEMNQQLDQLFGSHEPYHAFFSKLQKAVAADDKETVASMIDYPFATRIGGKAIKIRDAKHFIADYDKVITSKVKAAVAKQRYEDLFANWQGVMIGDGEVWFSGVDEKNTIKIIAIND